MDSDNKDVVPLVSEHQYQLEMRQKETHMYESCLFSAHANILGYNKRFNTGKANVMFNLEDQEHVKMMRKIKRIELSEVNTVKFYNSVKHKKQMNEFLGKF